MRILQVSDKNLFDCVIDRARILIKLKFSPHLPKIKRIFSINDELYIVRTMNETCDLVDYIQDTDIDWSTACDWFISFINTLLAMRRLNFNIPININTLKVCEDTLFLDDVFNFESIDALTAYENDVYDICAVIYFCLNKKAFISTESTSFDELLKIGENDCPLILHGLDVYTSNERPSLRDFYDKLVVETKCIYDSCVFSVSEFSLSSSDNILKQEKRYIQKQKKKKKKSRKKYKRKVMVLSTFVTSIAISFIAFAVLGQIFPSVIQDVLPFTSNSDVSASDVNMLYIYHESSVSNQELFSVPDLVGRSYDLVLSSVKYENFDVRVIGEAYSDEYAKGHVISQSIEKGEMVAKSTPIGIIVSLGQNVVEIPDLKGKTVAEAYSEFSKLGLHLGDQQEVYSSEVSAGKIISVIDDLKEAPSGSFIGVVVSLGSKC